MEVNWISVAKEYDEINRFEKVIVTETLIKLGHLNHAVGRGILLRYRVLGHFNLHLRYCWELATDRHI